MRAPAAPTTDSPPATDQRKLRASALAVLVVATAFLLLTFSPFSAAQSETQTDAATDVVPVQDTQGADSATPDLSGSDLIPAPVTVGSTDVAVEDVDDAFLADQLASDYILQQQRADQLAMDAAAERISAELSVLAADAIALDRRLARLDESIVGQESLLIEIAFRRDALATVQSQIRDEQQATATGIEFIHDRLTQRAVEAYMVPADGYNSEAIVADDFVELHTKLVLIDSVANSETALIDLLESEQERLRIQHADLAALELEAEAWMAAEESTSRAMMANRHEFEALSSVLTERIATFTAEADILEEGQAELDAVISAREDRFLEEARSRERLRTECEAAGHEIGSGADAEDAGAADAGDESDGPTIAQCLRAGEAPPPTSLRWPAIAVFSSQFGERWGRMHEGIDLAGPIGEPIMAAEDGVVYFAGRLGGYGNTVLIDHGGGMHTLYAHQHALLVAEGEDVVRGQQIGEMGSTGHSTGPHLHFEVQLDGVPVDPMGFLYGG